MFFSIMIEAYTAAFLGASWFVGLLLVLSMTETAWFWVVRAAAVAGCAGISAAALAQGVAPW